jgi:hypothetical protein
MNALDAFEAASGFQVSWVHFFMLLLSGAVVIIVAAALITCLIHKLNSGVFQQGASLITYMLFLAMLVAVFIGVLKTM